MSNLPNISNFTSSVHRCCDAIASVMDTVHSIMDCREQREEKLGARMYQTEECPVC